MISKLIKHFKKEPTLRDAAQILLEAHSAFIELKVPYILDGSTLLGFYETQAFLPGEHDYINFTVGSNFWERHKEIDKLIMDKGFRRKNRYQRNLEKHKSGQYTWTKKGITLDLMFKEFKAESKKAWWTIYGDKPGVTYNAVPQELLQTAKFYSIKIMLDEKHQAEMTLGIPTKTQEYIDYFKTDKCIVEPNNYESI